MVKTITTRSLFLGYLATFCNYVSCTAQGYDYYKEMTRTYKKAAMFEVQIFQHGTEQ
jgi:hypothetical protein